MSFSLPQSKLYALAEQARTKFDEAANAKDQHLSRLLAHAHLYDELEDHFEKLRMNRMSSSTCPPVQAVLPVPVAQEVARPHQQQDDDNSGWANDTAKGTFHKWDLINECAIVDDEEEEVLSPDCAGEGPLVVVEQVAPAEGEILTQSVPASPAAISDTSADKTTTMDSQVTVSEVPIDDDEDSDFESDSDCDTLVDQDELTATTISISKPKAPYHNIDLHLATKTIDGMEESNIIKDNDAFPALTRSKPSSQLPTSYDSSPATPASLKTLPLCPQLCDPSSCADVSSPIYHDLRLQQAMHRLLRLCPTINERTMSEEQ
ncbi:MAG: hypothetical protein L6R37_006227 [Teloschistes peruensis]|nr:MAG: hypothetical protein L6R37_006227 [Teloschistes peruensis]